MNYQLICFDLNGTLANTPFKDGQPLHALPGRCEHIQALYTQETSIAVLTNQGPPLWHEATGDPKFQSALDLAQDIQRLNARISLSATQLVPWYIALYEERALSLLHEQGRNGREVLLLLRQEMFHVWQGQVHASIGIEPDWRKPAPGMLLQVMRSEGVSAAETLYVGDREEDHAAAHAAGCDFRWAGEYFS